MECDCNTLPALIHRRRLLTSLGGLLSLAALGAVVPVHSGVAAALTKDQRDGLSIDQIIAAMKAGNERFVSGKAAAHDYLAQKRATSGGQYPAAVILSCIDSRAPAEIILDTRIGDTFNARVAGNVVNDDVLGSLEFACALAGAKVVLVMGHTACGAIKGAIDGAELGHLTALLARIAPAVAATQFGGDRTTKNPEFVDAVAKTHVKLSLDAIRNQSAVLKDLEARKQIALIGSIYHLKGGRVDFF